MRMCVDVDVGVDVYVDCLCLVHQLLMERLHSTGTFLRGTCRGWRRWMEVCVEGVRVCVVVCLLRELRWDGEV